MAQANNKPAAAEKRISDRRLTKVRKDISSRAKQLSTWVKKVEFVASELDALEDTSVNRPTIVVLEADRAYYQSKADCLRKEVDSLSKTLSGHISKNSRLDDERLGIDAE